MNPAAVATLAELVETFVPAADAGRIANLASEALLRAADPAQVTQLRLVLRALEIPAVNGLTSGRWKAFRDLPAAEREAILLSWAGSAIPQRRAGFHAFRKLLTFLAYADPGEAAAPNLLPAAVGYQPDHNAVTPEPTPIRPMELPRIAAGADGGPDAAIELDADVVIVGSGAGGGVVAAELARAGRSVVVLEAGPFVDESTMPRGELDAYSRLYLNHGLLSTWDGAVTFLAGSGVGGGTLVNWMTCIDVPPDVRAEWGTEHGLDGLAPGEDAEWSADVATVESELGVAPATVVPPKDQLILDGATALGWDGARIRRDAAACGTCGSCPFGCVAGAKQSGIRVHLRQAFEAGARIVDRVRVTRVLVDEHGRATGVEGRLLVTDPATGMPVIRDGDPTAAEVRRLIVRAPQVVLAAGALRSPAVLQGSGIAHPAVGRHLRIHPVSVLAARMREPVEMWRGTMQAARSLQFGQGDGSRRGYVIESAPGHLGLLALALPWASAADHGAWMATGRHIAPLIAITRDGGEGRTTLTRAGRVRLDYRLDALGVATLRHGLVSMARLARAAGGAEELVGVGMPPLVHHLGRTSHGGSGETSGRDAGFEAFVGLLGSMDFSPNRGGVFSAHQMGTIRMGASPADHPADPRGRIRRDAGGRLIDGLYVADGSTFPTGIGVNPMVGIMAMARRVSRTILAEGRAGG
ncbi:MAG: GMC family oxidoreductase N-terminal domain-containing protein [Chloroflexi bacterium]|nr:GMC family oxidoreductase N-terminal domain-containing protein [Chloroflexota bacterium]